jgi:hypothetical protein
VLAGIFAAEVLPVSNRERKRMTAGLCQEKLRVRRSPLTGEVNEFLFEFGID